MNERDNLVKLLENNITEKINKINEINKNTSEKKELEKIVESLKKDFKQLINIDVLKLKNILSNCIDDNALNNLIDNIDIIKILLNGILNEHLDFELDDSQVEQIEQIIKILEDRNNEIEKELEKQKLSNTATEHEIDKFKNVVKKLKINETYIVEKDIINKVFEEENIPYKDRNNILLELIKSNNQLYCKQNKIQNNNDFNSNIEDIVNINKDQIKELFTTYGYEYSKLNKNQRELITNYGNIDNIKEILKLLVDNTIEIPKTNYDLLTIILLYSNKDTLENIIEISDKYKINIKKLFKLPTVFIPKSSEKLIEEVNNNENKEEIKGQMLVSSYENFINNIDSFERLKIDTKKSFEDCNLVFLMPSEKLLKNLKFFKLYGFELYGSDTSALSALLSTNLVDNADKFIEVGALRYIHENPNRLSTSNKLLFYRLKHAKDTNVSVYRQFKGGSRHMWLSKDVTSTNGLGINETNCHQIINDIDVDIQEKDLYNKVVNKSSNDRITEKSLENEYIKKLDKFKVDDYVYNINGVLISRIKLLRIYETLLNNDINSTNALIFALTYKSIITPDDFEILNSAINALEERKVMR